MIDDDADGVGGRSGGRAPGEAGAGRSQQDGGCEDGSGVLCVFHVSTLTNRGMNPAAGGMSAV